MRAAVLGLVLMSGILVPTRGTAQVYYQPTPPPQASAANLSWQVNGEPVFYEGDYYFATGPTVYFDGNVMVPSGMYRGVPLYVDSTLTPYSIVYVPIGGNVMRPYERRRRGELAGTVASRTPSFPIEHDVEVSAAGGVMSLQAPPPAPPESPVVPEAPAPQAPVVGTSGTFSATGTFTATVAAGAAAVPAAASGEPARVVSIPAPQSGEGVWVEYNSSRWYSAGRAVPFDADRFVPIGTYHGFTVYRDRSGSADDIYIPSVSNGPLAPYRR